MVSNFDGLCTGLLCTVILRDYGHVYRPYKCILARMCGREYEHRVFVYSNSEGLCSGPTNVHLTKCMVEKLIMGLLCKVILKDYVRSFVGLIGDNLGDLQFIIMLF